MMHWLISSFVFLKNYEQIWKIVVETRAQQGYHFLSDVYTLQHQWPFFVICSFFWGKNYCSRKSKRFLLQIIKVDVRV